MNKKDMQALDPYFDAMVNKECENYKPGFESLPNFCKRHKLLLEKALAENLEMYQEGMKLLFLSDEWTEEEAIHFWNGVHAIKEIEKAKCACVGEMLGLNDLFYNKGYQIASNALASGKVDEAKKMFMTLAQLNPSIFLFSEGLGHALVEEGRYEEALVAFQTALQFTNEEEAYRLSLCVANMLLVLGHKDKAREAAEAIIEQIGSDESYTEELAMAKELLATR